jgi:UTP--glucose-1-phosphate uridylyltransferase
VQYEGQSFDCGSKIGFLSANIAFALERDDIRKEFLAELAARNITSTLVEAGGLAAAE